MTEQLFTVLLIEDEPAIRKLVAHAFQTEGWKVIESATLQEGLREARLGRIDLTMLDLGLPDGDGVSFLAHYRAYSTGPVIVLSARTDEGQKVAALDAGADDYLTKPFGIAELLARVRATMRRHRSSAESMDAIRSFGSLTIDLAARKVTKRGKSIHLTPTEYRLLALLVTEAGRVMTHRTLLGELWGPAHAHDSHYLRLHMAHLRAKIEDDAAQPTLILTEPAVGYRLSTDA